MVCRRLLPVLLVLLAGGPLLADDNLAEDAGRVAQASRRQLIFASPIQAGCYIAAPGVCKIHAEPFTIQLATGAKLVFFQLVTTLAGTGTQRIIYHFKPDQSNPVPFSGTTFTPSLVALDYGATCGSTYSLALQGQETGESTAFNLGVTGNFTCPSAIP